LSKIGKPRSTKGLAVFCARIAEEKIAESIILMNLSGIESAPTEYFVICTCETDIQSRALVDAIERKCKEVGIKRPRVEGLETANWVLLDFFDVVMHIMLSDSRDYYKLEKLWGDAQFLNLTTDGKTRVLKQENIYELLS